LGAKDGEEGGKSCQCFTKYRERENQEGTRD